MGLEPKSRAVRELCSTDMPWLLSEDHRAFLASASDLELRASLGSAVVYSHWKLVPIVARRLDLASPQTFYVAFDCNQLQ